jgi:uncharacterized protein DUF6262
VTDQLDGLKAATAQRSADTEQRVRGALRALAKDGATVSFASVAERARVSRAFLYAHRDLRAEIEALRDRPATAPAPLATRQRAGDASLRSRLYTALEDNRRLRAENTTLREELALAHGRNRELELELRTGRRT